MRAIPTLNQLYNSILADLEASISVNIPVFGKNFLRALAAVMAGGYKLLYLNLGFLQKNIFIDTADPESSGGTLERFGRVKLGRNPFGAVAGQYSVLVTGSAGGVIPASQTFKSDDDSASPGILYVLDSAFAMTGSSATVTLRALTGGIMGKLLVGNKLTSTSPIALVNSQVTVSAEVVQPLDAETIEDYRAKGLNAYRLEPEGGASSDYRLWSADAQGVKRVYPFSRSGVVDEMNIFVEAELSASIDGKGTPTVAILNSVESVINQDPDTTLPINDRGRRPAGVKIHPLPVTVRTVDIIITGYVGLNATIQALILSTITDAVNAVRPFVAAIDPLDTRNDILDTNKLISAILQARPGSIFTSVTLKIDGAILSSFEFDQGDIPYLNSVTYS